MERSFHRIAAGRVHVRCAGHDAGTPLLMVHGGPGSSASLAPLSGQLSSRRRVIAPDLMGHGDSDAPSVETSIAFYADTLADLLDLLGIEQVEAYGHHGGAQIVAQLAVIRPRLVRRLVLDGAALFPDEMRAEFLARYAPPLIPSSSGEHLTWLWDFASELTRHFPYYRCDKEHQLTSGIARPPDVLTDACVDMLKGWRTYHLLYQAAFRDDFAQRLPRVRQASLVLETEGDPLANYAAKAAALLPRGTTARVQRHTKYEAIAAFLNE